MECPACQLDNRAGRRFCAGCGGALAAPCVACGFVNQPDERFCGGCGVALGGGAATARPVAAPPRPSERRPVTALFADLAGYTRLSSTLDPEEVQALLTRFFETVDGVVLAYGGAIDKHIGDNVMGIFGAPVAHDNDPERAVRAAVEIHRRVEALAAELPVPLRVHIGLATGEVVASELGSRHHQEYTVTGDAVNLAARLQDKATAGETMVSDAVRRATEAVALFEAVGEVPIKGLAGAVPVFKLLGLRAARAAPRDRAFVGRRAEVRQLTSVLEGCLDAGRGGWVHLRGDAGIGKTRLVAEVRDRADGLGFASHVALVLDFGAGRGHGAMRAAVEDLLGVEGGADVAARAAAVAGVVAAGVIAPDDEPCLADLLDLAPAERHRALYQAMTDDAREAGKRRALGAALHAAAARRPTLLVIEDVHWADAATLGRLDALARAAAGCAAVVLSTSRVEGDPVQARGRGDDVVVPQVTLALAPLRTEEARALAGEVFGELDGVVRGCLERANGNPLYLEQLLEHARDATQGGVPASIQSLVLSRVDRLPAADRRLLQAAAVLGQRFELAAVRAILGAPAAGCDALVAGHLVAPVDDGYLFHHALIRDGVYASLTRGRRAELHRAAAAWFDGRDPVLRAEHLARAEDPAAAAAFVVAAHAEAEALRLDRAIALASRGRELATTAADRYALASLHGELARRTGQGAAAVEAYQAAVEAAVDDAARCRAWIGVAAGHRLRSVFEPAFAALDVAEPLAAALDLPHERAQCAYHRGSLLFACGREAASRREHERALAEARRAGDRELEARALSGLADADFAAGELPTARARYAACVALCGEVGLERYAIPNRLMQAFLDFWHDADRDVLVTFEELSRLAERLGERYPLMLTEMQRALVLVYRGRPADAVEQARRGRAEAERLGAHRYAGELEAVMAEALARAGDRPAALAAAERAVAIARAHGEAFCGPMSLGALAWLTEDPGQRREIIAEAERIIATGTLLFNVVTFHRHVVEGAVEAGDDALLAHHAERLAAVVEPGTCYAWAPARGPALAAWRDGRRDDALAATLREVLAAAARFGAAPYVPAEAIAFAAAGAAGGR
ncbi:MAG: AAA family ATPase [Kofleriaceae bacterium]|nr:AAA family ATPase [Kofleriaceae bacterium]